jgi:cell shape-determining protein MreD
MRPAIAVLFLGLFLIVLQGSLAHVLPPLLLPDLGLLVVLAAAIFLGPAEGLLLAALLGLMSDVLSASLLGEFACVRILELVLTRAVAGKLDLRRGLPFTVYTLAILPLDAALVLGLTRLYLGPLPLDPAALVPALERALPTLAVAAPVSRSIRRLIDHLGEARDRREMRLDTRRPVL